MPGKAKKMAIRCISIFNKMIPSMIQQDLILASFVKSSNRIDFLELAQQDGPAREETQFLVFNNFPSRSSNVSPNDRLLPST